MNIEQGIRLLALLSITTAASAQITYTPIAVTGLPAPGLPPGVNYSGSFSLPNIDATGQIAFTASITGPGVNAGNSQAMFVADVAGGSLIARSGDPAPGFFGDVWLAGFLAATSLGEGQGAVVAYLDGDGIDLTNSQSIWSYDSGGIDLLALEGDAAPGAGLGVRFNDISIVLQNSSGQVAMPVDLVGAGVTSVSGDEAIYLETPEGLGLVAREGLQAPGAAPGALYEELFEFSVRINDAGTVAYVADFTGGTGLYVGDVEGVAPVVLTGTAVPGAPVGVNFADFEQPSLNNAEETVFLGYAVGPGISTTGVYSTQGGQLHKIAESGDIATDIPFTPELEVLRSPLINDAGDAVFIAQLGGPIYSPTTDDVIYKSQEGVLSIVARQGQLISDDLADVRFGDVASVHFNDAGQVAFASSLQGPGVDATNDAGIFAEVAGDVRLVARKGDLFDVNPDPVVEDLRLITALSMGGTSGSQDGRPTAFNDAGRLAFFLSFADGSSGLFIASTGLVGDYNRDGIVNAADYTVWRDRLAGAEGLLADGNDDGVVDSADYDAWAQNYGQSNAPSSLATRSFVQAAARIPEPSGSICLAVLALLAAIPHPRTGPTTPAWSMLR